MPKPTDPGQSEDAHTEPGQSEDAPGQNKPEATQPIEDTAAEVDQDLPGGERLADTAGTLPADTADTAEPKA